jgi:hypothetical protein
VDDRGREGTEHLRVVLRLGRGQYGQEVGHLVELHRDPEGKDMRFAKVWAPFVWLALCEPHLPAHLALGQAVNVVQRPLQLIFVHRLAVRA